MKKFIIFSLLLIMLAALSCSPVRSKKGSVRTSDKSSGRTVASKEISPAGSAQIKTSANDMANNSQFGRFSDTTVVILSRGIHATQSEASKKFEEALFYYNNKNYDEACELFSDSFRNIAVGDSIYYEISFYRCECLIMKNELESGALLLSELVKDAQTPRSVLEKSLVRLGQVYCVLGDKNKAVEMFKRLKLEFPNSSYLSIANCDFSK